MNKEELEKEASEKYFNHKMSDFQGFYTRHYYYLGYVESAEPREKRIAELEEELEQERKINEEIKVRFVKCSSCTEEMKDKCLMFSENLCEGERCEELVDLVALVNQSELQNKCSELEEEKTRLKAYNEKLLNSDIEKHNKIVELTKEIKRLNKVQDNMQTCLEERYNEMCSYKDKYKQAKEIVKMFLAIANNEVEYVQDVKDCKDFWKELCERAEQFMKEVE